MMTVKDSDMVVSWWRDPGRAVYSASPGSLASIGLAVFSYYGVGNHVVPWGDWQSWWLTALVLAPLVTPVAYLLAGFLVLTLVRAGGNRGMRLATAARVAMLSHLWVALPALVVAGYESIANERTNQGFRSHAIPELWHLQTGSNVWAAHLPLPVTWYNWLVWVCGAWSVWILYRATVHAGAKAPGFSLSKTRQVLLGLPAAIAVAVVLACLWLRPIRLPSWGGVTPVETPLGVIGLWNDWHMSVIGNRVIVDVPLPGATMTVERIEDASPAASVGMCRVEAERKLGEIRWSAIEDVDATLTRLSGEGIHDGEAIRVSIVASKRGRVVNVGVVSLPERVVRVPMLIDVFVPYWMLLGIDRDLMDFFPSGSK